MFRRSCNCSSSSTLSNRWSPVARLRAAGPRAPSTNLDKSLQCLVLNDSPHSRWGRGIRCTSLSSREPGKIFLRVQVVSPQVFSSCFVQSYKSLSRSSNRSKNQPEFCLEYLSFGHVDIYLAINWTREVIASLGSIKAWASFSSMLRRNNNRSCSSTLSNVAPVARF